MNLPFLLDAAAHRHALQVNLKRTGPWVIRAVERLAVAVTLTAKTRAPVRSDVFDDVDRAIGVTHHDDRALAANRALVVARVRYLGLQPDSAPVALKKKKRSRSRL